jgi:hypothetical protein
MPAGLTPSGRRGWRSEPPDSGDIVVAISHYEIFRFAVRVSIGRQRAKHSNTASASFGARSSETGT